MVSNRIIENVSYKLLRIGKEAYHFSRIQKKIDTKALLFIVGCQRSGTSLMNRIFEKDFDTKVYSERSKLSSLDVEKKLRLNPLSQVRAHLDKDRVGFVVLKPLVESQNTLDLLEYFPESKALWMFRGYKQVVSSNLKRWGIRNGINNLRPIVKRDHNNWRAQGASKETCALVDKYFSEDMNPFDAAALFWIARNRLFFELELSNNSRVKLCKYEDLVQYPDVTMRRIYGLVNRKYPSDRIVNMVKSSSLGTGKEVRLSPEIDKLCSQLITDLDRTYQIQNL